MTNNWLSLAKKSSKLIKMLRLSMMKKSLKMIWALISKSFLRIPMMETKRMV